MHVQYSTMVLRAATCLHCPFHCHVLLGWPPGTCRSHWEPRGCVKTRLRWTCGGPQCPAQNAGDHLFRNGTTLDLTQKETKGRCSCDTLRSRDDHLLRTCLGQVQGAKPWDSCHVANVAMTKKKGKIRKVESYQIQRQLLANVTLW